MFYRIFKSCVPVIGNLLKNIGRNNFVLRRKCSSEVTAGILVIGDEILKGITDDVNTQFLIKHLNEINVKVNKVVILPDNIDAISSEVRELSSKCSFVLTSGGIGPTHDDVTYEAIAKASNVELELNQEIFQLLVNYFGSEFRNHPGIIKYSCVPRSAILNYIDINHNNKLVKYPIVSVQNIFIFPGVPILLQKSFERIKVKFMVQNKKYFSKEIFLNIDEFSITALLNQAVEKFHIHVKFGSYPVFNNNYYKVKLVLESQFQNYIEEAYKFFDEHLPKRTIVNIKKDILLSANNDVYSLSKSSPFVFSAVSVIEKAIEKYSLSELCLCFNGGKDCTALLHLFYSCVQHHKPEEWSKVNFLYVRCGEPFNEVETFIQECTKVYNFKMTTIVGNLRHSIANYLEANPNLKAVLMGTRKSDPGASNLNYFCSTDSNWPFVMRVLPLLDWTYSDIWFFLRQLQIPYCTLYDQGYTSLGVKTETIQNPSLLFNDIKGYQSFRPAYMLKDPKNERKSCL